MDKQSRPAGPADMTDPAASGAKKQTKEEKKTKQKSSTIADDTPRNDSAGASSSSPHSGSVASKKSKKSKKRSKEGKSPKSPKQDGWAAAANCAQGALATSAEQRVQILLERAEEREERVQILLERAVKKSDEADKALKKQKALKKKRKLQETQKAEAQQKEDAALNKALKKQKARKKKRKLQKTQKAEDQQKEDAAWNRFRAPQYAVTTVSIPGEDVTVLEFEQSGDGEPWFIIDHGKMLACLTAWVRIPHGTVCVINGLVKTGKTAALTNVLPQLVLEYFPDALFCHLDFNRFMRPLSSAKAIAASLLLRLESWARHNGFTVPQRADKANGYEGTKANISELMQSFADSCRKSDRKIYFLIDEVQRFFQTSNDPDRTLFKELLRISVEDGGCLNFAFTGSGMVRAWAEIVQCPANGTTVSASTWCVNLPATNPDAVLKYATDRLVDTVTKTAGHPVGNIEKAGLLEVLDTTRSVAGQSYLAGIWLPAADRAFVELNAELTSSTLPRSLDQTTAKQLYENVTKAASNKYYDEFKTDMLPLLCTISTTDGHGDDSMLMEMRCLADRTATKPPESSTFKRLHTTFFQHYIDTIEDNEGKLTYGFPNTPFSTLIKEHVSVKGVLQEPSGHNLLRYTHNELAMYRLSELVGDRVKDANQVAKKGANPPNPLSKIWRDVEFITHAHFKEMDWLVDPKNPETHSGLKVFLGWCNDGVQKVINHHRSSGKDVPFPHCLYLYALRNAFTHTADNKKGVRSAQLKRRIMMEGPPWNLNELLRKLEAQLVDKEKKSKKEKSSKKEKKGKKESKKEKSSKKGKMEREKRKADTDADAQMKAKKRKKDKKIAHH